MCAKPFNILELKARIRALLRRSGGLENQNNRITAGSLTVDHAGAQRL